VCRPTCDKVCVCVFWCVHLGCVIGGKSVGPPVAKCVCAYVYVCLCVYVCILRYCVYWVVLLGRKLHQKE
jgi:hypothetical protein